MTIDTAALRKHASNGNPDFIDSNPSPSQEVGAWCNGTADDPGCWRFVPLFTFQPTGLEQYDRYLEPYLIDGSTSYSYDRLKFRNAVNAQEAALANKAAMHFWETGRQTCPCGARIESPDTHPHVTTCPVGEYLDWLENDEIAP